MTETKWTPGPWACGLRPQFGSWYVRHDPVNWDGMGFQHICECPADKKGTHYGEMFRANAHLIAAAPTLYEALASLMDYAVAGVAESWGESAAEGSRALENAYAALAKARGEAQ